SGLVLQNNGGNNLAAAANGAFTFTAPVASGSPYAVTVLTQPSNPRQTCTITNASGSVFGANITHVGILCTTNTFTIGGAVSGHNGTGLDLKLNGTTPLTMSGNGAFAFDAIADGSIYSVAVTLQPIGQTCTVANGSDTIAGANVTNVAVTCATNTFSLGGTVSGLTGTLVLQVNGGNDLTLTTNGSFEFNGHLADSSPYSVTMLTQPAGQTCTVANGAGTVSGANVTSISVACSNNPTGYTTNFPDTESPISEGGIWTNGLTTGQNWTDVKTTGGKAVATQEAFPTRYSDDLAHLNKSFVDFADNQYAQATVYLAPGYTGNGGKHEVELLLRFEITANKARGYEVLWGIDGYIAIVRWNGPVGDFTPLYDPGFGSIAVPRDGDVLRAEIVGNIITVYKNGSLVATADIFGGNVWTEGQPGIGFWPVDGATPENLGWKNFEAGNLP
ncbi:MAG TPA: hypothetical protein VJT81_12395, partial [Burkholderiales bacterium]|nr:hypothetical protein [Burkholderiales bacterium]